MYGSVSPSPCADGLQATCRQPGESSRCGSERVWQGTHHSGQSCQRELGKISIFFCILTNSTVHVALIQTNSCTTSLCTAKVNPFHRGQQDSMMVPCVIYLVYCYVMGEWPWAEVHDKRFFLPHSSVQVTIHDIVISNNTSSSGNFFL